MKIILLIMISTTLLVAGCDRGGRDPVFDDSIKGQAAPGFSLPQLGKNTPLRLSDYKGKLVLLSFWASWCPPCRAEHPVLLDMQAAGIRVAGINFRDPSDNAEAMLAELGDPFIAGGFDRAGRTSIDWGVAAPPETFIIDGDGTVLFRFQGPLIGTDYERRFVPALQEALGG